MTIKDVAACCGVSVSTVSRVLNHRPDVSPAVREKVERAIKECHYIPSNTARDLVRPQSDAIGVVVRGADNPFFTPIIRSIGQAVEQAGYTMVLHQILVNDDELAAGAALARSKRLKGLILMGGFYDYTPERTAVLEVPFVCCTYANSLGSLDKDTYSSVSIDDQAEACRAVRQLISLGHRKIAVLVDSTGDRSISELRYRGYLRALREAGLEPDRELVIQTGDFSMEAAYRKTRQLLERRGDVTAIFAIADSVAIAAMKAIHDAGKRVPEDCSIIAIDGIDMSLYTIPTLTTLIQPQETMGAQAVEILTDVLEGRAASRHVRLETTLRQGGSVAPPPTFSREKKQAKRASNSSAGSRGGDR